MYRARVLVLLVLVVVLRQAAARDVMERYSPRRPLAPPRSDQEYIRHIHSMLNAVRSGGEGRLVIETASLVDTQFRTSKRNADLINSLLALPKGMNDAGR